MALRARALDELDCSAGSSSPLTRFTPDPGCGQILTKHAARPSAFGKTRPNILPDQGIFAIIVPEWTVRGCGLTYSKKRLSRRDHKPYSRLAADHSATERRVGTLNPEFSTPLYSSWYLE